MALTTAEREPRQRPRPPWRPHRERAAATRAGRAAAARADDACADLDARAGDRDARPTSFPWTRGNFVDSLAAGYRAQVLRDAGGVLVGYCVAMAGVQEMHLLNLTVAPP